MQHSFSIITLLRLDYEEGQDSPKPIYLKIAAGKPFKDCAEGKLRPKLPLE